MLVDILFEDDDLIIVNKPNNLLCVPGLVSPDNLHDRLLQYNANIRVIHRLDMATSGIVIFAKHYHAQKAMSQLFSARKVLKTYLADIYGAPNHDYGTIESPMICDWPNRPKQKIDWVHGKHAKTHYSVLERNKKYSQVKLHPHTGRTHQLRLHMWQLGHPILGDQLYHIDKSHQQTDRLHLHAFEVAFTHPTTNTPHLIHCPVAF